MKATIEDSHLTLSFEEVLTSTTVQRLRRQFIQALDEAASVLCVNADISQVEMIDSQGLNFIIGMFNDARARGKDFRLCGASEANRRLFAIVNLQEYVNLS